MANKKKVKDQVTEAIQSLEMDEEDIDDLHEMLGITDIPEIVDPYNEGTVQKEEEDDDEEAMSYEAYLEFMKKSKKQAKKAPVKKETVVEQPSIPMGGVIDEGEDDIPVLKAPETPKTKKTTTAKKQAKKVVEEVIVEPEDEEVPEIEIAEPEVNKVEEEKIEGKKLTKKQQTRNEIINMNFNVDEIEIVEEPAGLSKIDDYDIVFNAIPTYQVVCNQSRYVAHMAALKYKDSLAIQQSTNSIYTERERIYRMIYDKIEDCSIKNMSYKDFLKLTSFYDVDTLLFGIYQQSFPGDTEFTIECKHCKTSHTIKVKNENLIATKNEEVYKNIQEIISSVSTPADSLKHSVVNKTTRKVLHDSKLVVDIAIPSLKDHLDLLGSVKQDVIMSQEELITVMLHLKGLYTMNVKATKQSGTPKYYKIEGKEEIARTIKDLTLNDEKELKQLIFDKINTLSIDYAIKSFDCPNSACRKELGNMAINIEQLLFFRMLQ